jgi:hypothetical protein
MSFAVRKHFKINLDISLYVWRSGFGALFYIGVRFPAKARIFSLRYRVQTGSRAPHNLLSYWYGRLFPRDKAAEA